MDNEKGAQVVKEGRDWEAEAAKRPLTDAEIREKLPEVWKERARVARLSISVPIPGTDLYT